MRNFLKHQPKAKLKPTKAKDKKRLLEKESIKSCGAVSLENDGFVKTQDGKSYAIFDCNYIDPNGLDYTIDEKNEAKVNELIKTLGCSLKFVFVSQQKNNLNQNIAFFEKRIAEEKNKGLKERMEERLLVMKYHNEIRYSSLLAFIQSSSVEDFEKLAPSVFKVKRKTEFEVMELLHYLNNGLN